MVYTIVPSDSPIQKYIHYNSLHLDLKILFPDLDFIYTIRYTN